MTDDILSRRADERLALVLVVATLAWNLVEAVVAIVSGWRASSVALVGFGLDSVIESVAATALLWRLAVAGGDPARAARADRRVLRLVGGTFIALAVYVLAQASWQLLAGRPASESLVGIVLAVASTVVMPLVAIAKLRVARRLGSSALVAEAKETLACAWLSVALLLGLAANATVGWWQADPLAALVMVPWLVKEGIEGLRGEGCCG